MILFCFASAKQEPWEYQRYTFVITNLQIQSDMAKNNGGEKNPEELKQKNTSTKPS